MYRLAATQSQACIYLSQALHVCIISTSYVGEHVIILYIVIVATAICVATRSQYLFLDDELIP